MQLNEVPAKTGYIWFRQGIWLFRRNPFAFLTLFFAYLFGMMLISLIPVLGSFLPLVFIPGIAVGFMAANREAALGKPVFPTILVEGFRRHGAPAARQLLVLGLVYIVAILAVFGVSALVDGGGLMRMMVLGGDLDRDAQASGLTTMSVLVAMGAYIPVAMLFWFAPVLVAWHQVPPHKALFFSLVACWRNRGAFILYALIWGSLAVTVSVGLTLLLSALGMQEAAIAVLMPASVVLSSMLYCSFYATYRGCFDPPDTGETATVLPQP